MNRSLEILARDQADIFAEYRLATDDRNMLAVLPRPGTLTPLSVFARVSSIVTSDPTYGDYLMVVIQKWTGTPPAVSDSTAAAIRCYPTPNHTVADYTEDEIVLLLTAHGAMVAGKLS